MAPESPDSSLMSEFACMQLLVNSFNASAAEGVMCRDTVSVGWDGRIYDCDFNQQLEMGLRWASAPMLALQDAACGHFRRLSSFSRHLANVREGSKPIIMICCAGSQGSAGSRA